MVGGGRVRFGGEVTASREIAPRILRVVTLADGETIHNMKLHYYPETDSLYVELKAGPGAETREGFDRDQRRPRRRRERGRLRYRSGFHQARSGHARDRGVAGAVVQGWVVRGRWPVAGGSVARGADRRRLISVDWVHRAPAGFKEMLASCPVDLDLDRPRNDGRAVEI